MRNPQKCGFFYFIYRYLLLNNIKTMYKNFNLTDQERKEILEQHQSKGYKQPLKESSLENSVDEIGLTPDEVDENLGMLARIAAPMAASYVGSKMADTNENFIDSIKSGVSNVVGGVQKGMNTLASGMANTLTSDADLKKFNDRILAIANVIKYAKKGTDPKTQQPAWMIINPQSKVNGMRLDEYFKTYRVSVGEVEAAKLVNQQGGKPLSATQKLNTSGNQYYRSYAAHPPTFAKLFNEQSSFIDSVKSGLADVGRGAIDARKAYVDAGRNVVAAAKSGLADVGRTVYNALPSSSSQSSKTPSNLVACSALGVKFAGLCDKVTKKPVVECAKLGVKTVGYCFVDTKQPVNVLTPKGQPQPLSELGGYIGDAPEKIDGPFMKEIDPSVYEDISYLDAMKADILLMRLFHNDIISKDAFLEVRKPVDEIVKILKGGYFEKEKDLPF